MTRLTLSTAFVATASALLFLGAPGPVSAQLHFSDDKPAPVVDQAREDALRTARIKDKHREERAARRAAERAGKAVPNLPPVGRGGDVPASMRERIEQNRQKKFDERRRYREEQRAERAERQAESRRLKDEAKRKKEEKAKQLEAQRRELAFAEWQKKLKVDHVPKKPAPAFLKRFEPYVLSLGSVSLLRDTVTTVQQKHKGCTLIPNESSEDLGRLVCTDTRDFGSDGEAVIFGYLRQNDVIVTADFFFRQQQKLENRTKALLTQPPFQQHFKAPIDDVRYESPMYTVTQVENPVESIGKGSWLRIQTRYLSELGPLDRIYASDAATLDFGELVVGKTSRDDIENYTLTCRKVSADQITHFSEFYGQCFGFTEDAFYQLEWEPETNLLSQLTITPVRVAIANLLDETLRAKYGRETFCSSLDTDARVYNRSSRKTFKAATMYVEEKFRKEPANVFLGACDEPYVFTTSMRYVFRTVVLGEDRIAADYKDRLHENEIQSSIVHWRQDQLEKFKDILTPPKDDAEPVKPTLPDNIKTYKPQFVPSAPAAPAKAAPAPSVAPVAPQAKAPEKPTTPARVVQPKVVQPKVVAPPRVVSAPKVAPAVPIKTAPAPAPEPVKAVRPQGPVVPPTVHRLTPPKVIEQHSGENK